MSLLEKQEISYEILLYFQTNYIWKRKCISLNMKDFVNNFDLLNYEKKKVLKEIQYELFSDSHYFNPLGFV